MRQRLAPLLSMKRNFNAFFLSTAVLIAFPHAAVAQDPLTIRDAVRIARERNERVAAAQQRVEAAEARVDRARAFFFPDVNLTSTYTRRGYETVRNIGGEDVTIQSKDNVNSTANLSSVLFNARAFPLYRQARFNRQSTELDAADTTRLVEFEAADAFLFTLSAEQVQRASERRLEFARASLADARARFDAGLVSSNDVTKAELEVASAEVTLSRAIASATNATLQLGNLLDMPVSSGLQEPAPLLAEASSARPDAEALAATASTARLDLASERSRISALRAFAQEPSRRFIPTLNLNGQYSMTNQSGLSGRDNDGYLSLSLGWTPWDGGEALAEAAERRANVREAELELQRVERGVTTEIRQSVATLGTEQTAIASAATAVAVARKNYDETGELYRQGLASALEVADAAIRLFEAEVAEARARYQLALAYLDVRAAAGLEPLPAADEAAAGTAERIP